MIPKNPQILNIVSYLLGSALVFAIVGIVSPPEERAHYIALSLYGLGTALLIIFGFL